MMAPPAPHEEALLRLSLAHYEATGEYRDPAQFQTALLAGPPPDAVRSGGCFVFLHRLFRPAPASATGGGTKKPNKVTERLNQASAALENRASGLTEKASTLRTTARTLHANGDKRGAIAMLRRAKAVEKQAESAHATQISLEQQMDMLENQAVQKSVSEALASAVKKSKRSSRGLLSKAESAVEDSAEMQDLHTDLQAVMGELGNQGAEVFDEDELAAELAEMMAEDAPVAAPATSASPDSVVSMEALDRYPRAPATLVHAVQGVAAGDGV